jgi:hypothetical protein
MPDYEFTQYRRKQIAELRPYIEGENVSHVSISPEDAKAGSPKRGDMIARNPKNHADQWLVARAYFLDNFEALTAAEQAEPATDVEPGRKWPAFVYDCEAEPNMRTTHTPSEARLSAGFVILSRSEVEEKDKEISELRDALDKLLACPAEQAVTEAMVARASAEYQEIFGRYLLSSHARRILKAAMDPNRAYPSVEAAKAAAQADYERRILDALEPAEPATYYSQSKPVASRRWDTTYPGGQWLYFTGPNQDGEKLYTHPSPSETRLREALHQIDALDPEGHTASE